MDNSLRPIAKTTELQTTNVNTETLQSHVATRATWAIALQLLSDVQLGKLVRVTKKISSKQLRKAID